MASEVELKRMIPALAGRDIVRLPWLREVATGERKSEKLVTVYFDAPKRSFVGRA